ncbi:MAG: methyltransferase domain-containing protein [Gemmatimonadota bacterium]|nr:methyltransferase domain-containing protein [Gemmatimonadota bacterium]
MKWKGVELCCPACRGALRETGDHEPELRCDACDRNFPIILGIPDLRIFSDPYINMDADRAKARKVAERYEDLDLRGLVEYYYSMTSVVTRRQAAAFTHGLLAGPARAEDALRSWEGAVPTTPSGCMLEIGCGTAPLLVAARPRYRTVVGADIAFRWLAVAKKRLAEAGADVPLLCACAEALPLRDATFDRVIGDSVIENVQDPERSLAEAHRVLRPGGRLFLSTSNRFSLGPDPQTGVWAAGYLPRRVLEARVRRQGGIPPKRRLLSGSGLSRLIRRAGFARGALSLPTFSAEQLAHFPLGIRRLVDAYHVAARLPVSRHLLFVFGPKLYATAKKTNA